MIKKLFEWFCPTQKDLDYDKLFYKKDLEHISNEDMIRMLEKGDCSRHVGSMLVTEMLKRLNKRQSDEK